MNGYGTKFGHKKEAAGALLVQGNLEEPRQAGDGIIAPAVDP